MMDTQTSALPLAGPSPQDRPTKFTAPDLVAREFKPVRWVIPDLLPEGLALLAGNPKVGKSWLAMDLAIAIAETGPVLYLALEDNERRLQSRLVMLLGNRVAPDQLEFHTAWPDLDHGGSEALEEWLALNPAARAVVIDTMARIHPDRKANADIYLADNRVWGKLQQLTGRHSGLTTLVLHHLKKGQDDDPVRMVSGSHGVTGSVDTVMVLAKSRDSESGSLYVVGRDVAETSRETRLADGVWYDEGPVVAAARSREQRQLLESLATHGPLPATELAALTGISDHAARQRLYRMKAADLVTQRSDRAWTLSETSETFRDVRDSETSRRLAHLVMAKPEWEWDDYWSSVEAEADRSER